MRNLRFNIAGLLLVIFVLGIGFAALRVSDDLWESSIFTLTLGMLLVSILLGVHRSGSKRAFWIGFALFGWGYLALAQVPSIESRLLTTKGLAYLDSKVPGRPPNPAKLLLGTIRSAGSCNQIQDVAFAAGLKVSTGSDRVVRVWDVATGKLLTGWTGTTENFIRIGHSLLALLIGWLGGRLSRRLSGDSSSPEASTAHEAD
jgi:hypothetical protein